MGESCALCGEWEYLDLMYLIADPNSYHYVCYVCYEWEAWKIPGNLLEKSGME